MIRILFIEDDTTLRKLLTSDLELEGYHVQVAKDGFEGLELAKQWKPDLVILDVMLPKMDGYEVCRNLRKDGSLIPILMLTAKGQETEKVVGLDVGADDYVVKPVGTLELHARLKALLRRHKGELKKIEKIQFNDLELDFKKMIALKDGKPLALTAREFQMLEYFLRREDEVIRRQQFLEDVWGYDVEITTRAVDNQILSLRQKLSGKEANAKDYIHTVHGVGYRFSRSSA